MDPDAILAWLAERIGRSPRERMDDPRGALGPLAETMQGMAASGLRAIGEGARVVPGPMQYAGPFVGEMAAGMVEHPARTAADFTPVVGDVLAAKDAKEFAQEGQWPLAALAAASIIPGVPAIHRTLKGAARGVARGGRLTDNRDANRAIQDVYDALVRRDQSPGATTRVPRVATETRQFDDTEWLRAGQVRNLPPELGRASDIAVTAERTPHGMHLDVLDEINRAQRFDGWSGSGGPDWRPAHEWRPEHGIPPGLPPVWWASRLDRHEIVNLPAGPERDLIMKAKDALATVEPWYSSPRPINTVEELMQGRSRLGSDYDAQEMNRLRRQELGMVEGLPEWDDLLEATGATVPPGAGAQWPGPIGHPERAGVPVTVFKSPDGTLFSVFDGGESGLDFRLYADPNAPGRAPAPRVPQNPFDPDNAALHTFEADDIPRLAEAHVEPGKVTRMDEVPGATSPWPDDPALQDAITRRWPDGAGHMMEREGLVRNPGHRPSYAEGRPETYLGIKVDVVEPYSGEYNYGSNRGRAGETEVLRATPEVLRLMAARSAQTGRGLPSFTYGERVTGANRGFPQAIPTERAARRLQAQLEAGELPTEFATILRQMLPMLPAAGLVGAGVSRQWDRDHE
jgi:hypothetical protein